MLSSFSSPITMHACCSLVGKSSLPSKLIVLQYQDPAVVGTPSKRQNFTSGNLVHFSMRILLSHTHKFSLGSFWLMITTSRCKYVKLWKVFIKKFVKGATKLYFMYYLCVIIILFSMGLYKSAFSTYSFGKTRFSSFCVLVFRVSVSLAFNFQFCSMFWIECLLKRFNNIV